MIVCRFQQKAIILHPVTDNIFIRYNEEDSTGNIINAFNFGNHADTLLDTTVITPESQVADSTQDTTQADIKSVTGKVVDGAMNSVFVEVEPGNSIEFSYSQLDRNDSEVFYNWSIDDEITVKYVETNHDGEQVDSVVSIQKAE